MTCAMCEDDFEETLVKVKVETGVATLVLNICQVDYHKLLKKAKKANWEINRIG